MHLVRIANPHVSPQSSKAVELVLGYGDAIAIGRGTDEFMQALLRDLEVDAGVAGWQMQRFRTRYFDDFPDDAGWQDHWGFMWKVRIDTDEELGPLRERDWPFIESDAFDVTHSEVGMPSPDATMRCIVFSDFFHWGYLDDAQEAISTSASHGLLAELREQHGVGVPEFRRYEILTGVKQLEIDLGEFPGVFFAAGAGYAEAVMDECRRRKGGVRYDDSLP